MKKSFVSLSLSLIFTAACLAQNADDSPPEKAAVVANDRAYEAAYARGDAAAMAAFFSDDADYTAEDGSTYSGREAIESAIRSGHAKGSKLEITADIVRVLTPETVLEKGLTVVTSKEGEASTSQYTAIHVKKDGKWKINQLVESPAPAATPREHLSELSWLAGKWEESDKTNDLAIHSEYQWARGGNFLTRNVSVKQGGNVTLEGWQIIGWDPVTEQIRSWTFDGEGGFTEGRFTRDGDRWLIRESGFTPEGGRITSEVTIAKKGTDRFTWESNNRTLDGDPQPAIGKIEINRAKGD